MAPTMSPPHSSDNGSNHRLAKRVSLEMSTQPLDKAMVGAIAGGAVFIALFLLGLGVFVYLYYRSAEQPSATNLNAPAANSSDGAAVERGEQEQAEKTSDASDTSSSSASVSAHPAPHQPSPLRRPVPAPADSPHSPHSPPGQPGLAIDSPQPPPPPSPSPPPRPPSAALQPQHSKRRTLQKGDPWHRQSLASSNSLDADVPPTPGNEFV